MPRKLVTSAQILLASLPTLVSSLAVAVPFGSPDARGLAMGGTGVAAAENAHAAYYNPALLAAYSERKHRGGNQRIVFPLITAGATDNVELLFDIEDADYETSLGAAINGFNNGQPADTVLAVLNPLDADLRSVSNEPLSLDATAGIVVTIPDRREGGALSVNRRAVLDGVVDYNAADTALIGDYLEELEFVRGGGTPAALHPQLYQGGQLVDPNAALTSRADAVALIIDELALSMAWEVEPWGDPIMLGFTPKWVKVTTYEYTAVATSEDLTEQGELDNGENFNLDLGYAQRLGDRMTVGVVVKNLIPRDYETASGTTVELQPQLRIGSEYRSNWGTYNIDLDLLENAPLTDRADPSQELALGGEWPLGRHRLRAGMHVNFAGSGDNGAVGYGVGVRLRLLGMFVDLTATDGANGRNAAFQFGVRF